MGKKVFSLNLLERPVQRCRQPSAQIPARTCSADCQYLDIVVSMLKVSVRQIKAARALLGWSQDVLAGRAGVSIPTVKRLEAVDGVLRGRTATTERLRSALESAGIEFTNEEGTGVRLRKAGPGTGPPKTVT